MIFRTIVEAKDLANAQLILNISQSSVSASLAELEARLGLRLCNRGRAGFALTDTGRIVYEGSRELFDTVAKFAASTAAISNSTRGILRIGAVDAIATNPQLPLAQALRKFRKIGRNVLIDFLAAGPENLEAQVLHGKRDIVIGAYTERYAALAYVPLHAEQRSLYVAKGDPLFNKPDVDRDTLEGHAFVSRRYLHSTDLLRVGLSDPQAIVDAMEVQLMLVLCGEYLGYLPEHYAQNWRDRSAVQASRPEEFSYKSQFYAVSVKQRIPNPLINRFIGLLTEDAVHPEPHTSAFPINVRCLVDFPGVLNCQH